jgi:poly(3-hydroxybutyrate) depolymerase
MKAPAKILGFAVAALIVAALGFYFIEVYTPSPANPSLSAAIQQNSIPIGSMTREFLEYVPHDISPHSPHSPLVIVLHGSLMDAKSMREWTGYEFDQLADQHGFVAFTARSSSILGIAYWTPKTGSRTTIICQSPKSGRTTLAV